MSKRVSVSAKGSRRPAAGFTLLELVIAVAIVAILIGLALPDFREFSMRMTVTDNTNALVGALNSARSEAVKRGRQVALIANGGNWNNGWQIVAGKATATGSVDAPEQQPSEAACAAWVDLDGETPLCPRWAGPIPDNYRILGRAVGSGTVDDRIIFNSSGGLASPATHFDFSVCRPTTHPNPAQSRQVMVARSGIVTTQRDTTGAPAGDCG
ncbi:MAG: GspH/FimT family pseudopilin [Dokdonella sp.]|uniref:GspH/FimT family pseudopilin n=1 Tax=Dokdonella sp. TaxID=2291710 RepID=UPI003F823795